MKSGTRKSKKAAAAPKADRTAVFTALRRLMAPYAKGLDVTADTPADFCVYTRHVLKNKTQLFFGAVQVKKNYVSYHFMPVYVDPGLLAGVSPALKKRMQGKSCFNFPEVDRPLFKELAALTKAGHARYRAEGYIAKGTRSSPRG
jgi:hypothetical protein